MKPTPFLIGALALAIGCARPVAACSAFLLDGADSTVVGFNENWKHLPGMVVVNKRGIQKRGLTWDVLTAETWPKSAPFSWEAKYGSVTFNALGIDLATG